MGHKLMKEYIDVVIEKIIIDKADIICSSDIDFPDDPNPVENSWRPPGSDD